MGPAWVRSPGLEATSPLTLGPRRHLSCESRRSPNGYLSRRSAPPSSIRSPNARLSPLAAAYIPTFEELLEGYSVVSAKKLEIDDKVAKRRDVESGKRQFRDIGERKLFIDKVDATFKVVHGELGKLQHEVLGLPNDFADRFFRSDSSRDDDDESEEPTIESVTARLAEIEEERKANEARLAELEAKKLEEEKAAAQREVDKAALADLQKTIAEKSKLASKLKAKLEGA